MYAQSAAAAQLGWLSLCAHALALCLDVHSPHPSATYFYRYLTFDAMWCAVLCDAMMYLAQCVVIVIKFII